MSTYFDPYKADISWLNERLATGGDLQADNVQAAAQCADLVEQGVTHIIDCRDEFDDTQRYLRFAPSITVYRLGVDDHGGRQSFDWWLSVLERSASILDRPENKLFIHCHMGVNRGPSAAFLVLVSEVFKMYPLDAYKLIRARRLVAYGQYVIQALDFLLVTAEHQLSPWSRWVFEGNQPDSIALARNMTWSQELTEIVNSVHQQKAQES